MCKKTKLAQHILKEQNDYLDAMRQKSPDEIIARAYEICYREEIAIILESTDFDDDQMTTLLNMPNPVGFIYSEWLKVDAGVSEMLTDHIKETILV